MIHAKFKDWIILISINISDGEEEAGRSNQILFYAKSIDIWCIATDPGRQWEPARAIKSWD